MPEMMRKLGFDYKDGRAVKSPKMIGSMVFVVFGLPKVGKTILTKVVFHKISHLFDSCSFLENVRDKFDKKEEVSLQNKLIRELKGGGAYPEVKSSTDGTTIIKHTFEKKRVLIVLDNVDDFEQIKIFAEELTWFGQGSRIILTTTNIEVIKDYKNSNEEKYRGKFFSEHEVSRMTPNVALDLFYKYAFPSDRCLEGYKDWSSDIIFAVDCHPFAIEMVGRYLYGRSEEYWAETTKDLKINPQGNVESILMEYFTCLHDDAQQIFLDIACFFTEVEKRIPNYMWDACGWNPRRHVGHLENISFLRIGEGNKFWMHNQLKLLGRRIVKKEDDDPGQRSRLWDNKDVERALRGKKVIEKVKAIHVASNFNRVDGEEFHNLPKLRFLRLDNVDIEGNPENLLPNLVWLDWRKCRGKSSRCPEKSGRCPEKSKLFAFNMEKLAILNLCSRPDKLTVKEWKQLMEKAQSLEVLKLKDCAWINASLEIPASSHLKCLILEGSLHLKLDTTDFNFNNLVSFNMKHCKWVKYLPKALCSMRALTELLIDGTKIAKLQFEEGSLPLLKILSACKCRALREVTNSIGFLEKLRKLNLRHCDRLKALPHVFGKLVLLQEMDLSYTLIDELPPSVKKCRELQVLKMVFTKLRGFPEAIKNLKELQELDFSLCRGLGGQRCDITGLFSLRILRLEGTGISEVLAKDERQFCLHILELDDGVARQTQTSQKKKNVSKHKRKREAGTSQNESCGSKRRRKRDEE